MRKLVQGVCRTLNVTHKLIGIAKMSEAVEASTIVQGPAFLMLSDEKPGCMETRRVYGTTKNDTGWAI